MRGQREDMLMEEELPKWLGEAELLAQQTREAADVVDGPRERKATSYGGNELSERDFTRFMQSGLELDQWQRLEEVRLQAANMHERAQWLTSIRLAIAKHAEMMHHPAAAESRDL